MGALVTPISLALTFRVEEPSTASKADKCTAAKKAALFDHLVGGGENRIRHGHAEGLGGLEIDDELEPGRQLDRQLARLGTIENAIDIGGRTPVAVGEVLAVADQSSGLYVLPEREDRRPPVLECELRDSLALLDEK